MDPRLSLRTSCRTHLTSVNVTKAPDKHSSPVATAQARLQACALPEASVWRQQLQRQQARILQTLPQLQRELRQLARH